MNDFLLGIMFAIPVFALILLLFRDIVIKHFLKYTLIQARPEMQNTNTMLIDSIIDDVLVSYKLLLTLKVEFEFLLDNLPIDTNVKNLCNNKINEINTAIKGAEIFFEEKDNKDYLKIRNEVEELTGCSLTGDK